MVLIDLGNSLRASSPAEAEQSYREAAGLLIGGHVFQVGHLLQPVDEAVGPVVQFVGVGIFERVLVLCAAYAVVDGNVLHGLHE